MRNDSSNYCRSDAALGHAVRMLLLNVCDPGCGYSDHDVPQAVWRAVGTEMEAFMEANAVDLALVDARRSEVGSYWVGDRNGDGIGFTDLYLNASHTAAERMAFDDACKRLQTSAKSQGPCSLYVGDDSELYYTSESGKAWEAAYELARIAYVY